MTGWGLTDAMKKSKFTEAQIVFASQPPFSLRREVSTSAIFFLIALSAELAGFLGWMNGMTKGGNVFQLSSAFWNHEISRIRIWLPVFLALSTLRILALYLSEHLRAPKSIPPS